MKADVIAEHLEMKLTRMAVLDNTMDFTCYFFKQRYNRKFVEGIHHQIICDTMDKIYRGELTKVMFNIAPRYGKTEVVVKNGIAKGLALNAAAKFIHLSYSDDLALDNSEGVKEIVESEAYRKLFPEVQIKKDSKAKKKWYTYAGGGVYATSAGGQVTGFGAGQVDMLDEELEAELDTLGSITSTFGGALIIDDPIKPEDADSEARRERINARYDSTIKNRVNSRKTPIIIIMQRLHERDLCGYLLENEPGEWTVVSLPCIQEDEDGNEFALWDFKHTLDELHKMRDETPLVFGRQYMQHPMPPGGLMYPREWRTYHSIESLPYVRWSMKKAYVDTADLGTDYLCSIAYIETETAMYVTDVEYTQQGMEVTEPLVARQILRNELDLARIESNNGGRGFARNVESQVRIGGDYNVVVDWFHQSKNKEVRIFTNAATVQNLVVFPVDWETRWSKFAKHIKEFMAAGGNKHDDAPDTLTGMVEYFGQDSNINATILANSI